MTQRTKDTLIPNLLRLSQLAGIIGLIFVLGKREHLIETLQQSDSRQDIDIRALAKIAQDLTTTVTIHEFKLLNVDAKADADSQPMNFGMLPSPDRSSVSYVTRDGA